MGGEDGDDGDDWIVHICGNRIASAFGSNCVVKVGGKLMDTVKVIRDRKIGMNMLVWMDVLDWSGCFSNVVWLYVIGQFWILDNRKNKKN